MHAAASIEAGRLIRACGMVTDPDARRETVLAPVVGELALDRDGAVEGGGRVAKRDEESITRVVDLLALMTGEALAHSVVEPGHEVVPRAVTDRLHQLRRSDDVAEEQRPVGD